MNEIFNPPTFLRTHASRIVVLGHSGFLGTRFFRAAQTAFHGVEVIGLSSKELDLTKDEAGEKLAPVVTPTSTVVLFSGKLKVPADGIPTLKANLHIATTVAEAVIASGPKRVIYISSGAVFGEQQAGYLYEDTPPAPTSWYGIAKWSGERILAEAASRVPGCSLTVVRPSTVYGVGDKNPYTPTGFLASLLAGQPVTLWGDGSERRDFLYIDDFVRMLLKVTAGDSPLPLVHMCGSTELSYRECLDLCQALVGDERPVQTRPRTRLQVDQVLRTRTERLFDGTRPLGIEDGLRRAYTEWVASFENAHP